MNKEELEMFLLDLYNTKEPILTEKGKQKIIKTIEDLQDRIDKAIEYIEKYLQEHIIDEYPDEQSTFYDEKDRFIPNAKEQLLDILKGDNK